MNTVIFGGLAILSLFVFFNLGKVKASRKQTDRSNRINRFGNRNKTNIIEGESKEIIENEAKLYEKLREIMSTKEFVKQYAAGLSDD